MSEFMQDLDSMLTAAYADGRQDERAEWHIAMTALLEIAEKDPGGYFAAIAWTAINEVRKT
jgi:hypothetical protein